jgi:hypothetical protein
VLPLIPGTKDPLPGSRGVYDATTDIAQIRRWWTENSRYNIGVHCGASGLLSIDLDTYKEKYQGPQIEFPETVTVRSAHGGTHLWFYMPQGKRYGNSRGALPPGIDIRGFGGYVVVPPSIFVEDGAELPYTYAHGHKPSDIAPSALPYELFIILDAAQTAAYPVHFSEGLVPLPDLARFALSAEMLDLIANGAPKGERSEADYRVILALARSGASDDEIRSVFVHYAVGAKFREKGASGNKYLAYSIGKARTWLEDHPPDPKASTANLAAARQWVRSAACLDRLRAAGVRRVADLVPILDAIVELAQTRRTARIVTTVRAVADLCAIATSTAYRRLAKVGDAGLITMQPVEYGTLIDLSPILEAAKHNELDPSGTLSTIRSSVGGVPLGSSCDDDFFADHRIDEAFTNYPRSYAIKRRGLPADTELNPGLNSSGLVLWAALAKGGTVKELAEATGLTEACVRATVNRYDQSGLLFIWKQRRANVYELHPNFEERLDEARPQMTTYGIGQLRAARNASSIADFAQHKLDGRMPLEPGEKSKLENRRDKADAKAGAHHDALLGMGINPFIKVRPPGPPRSYLKIDQGEEWVSIHRPIFEQWQELADLQFADRYRKLGMAGYTRQEIDAARRMATKVGRSPRQFVGVGQQEAVAA